MNFRHNDPSPFPDAGAFVPSSAERLPWFACPVKPASDGLKMSSCAGTASRYLPARSLSRSALSSALP
jgi:hypothetical protein